MNVRRKMNSPPVAVPVKIAAGLLAGALLFAAPAAWTAGAPLVDIPRCAVPPVIDAELSDPCWQTSLVIFRFVSVSHSNRPATNVIARLLRDDIWLYVAADITHPEPTRIFPQASAHDGYIQGENCIKIALDPARGKPTGWYLFRVSADNIKSDVYVMKPQGIKPAWGIPWRSSARINPRGWRVEIAIPVPLLAQWSPFSDTMGLNIVAHVVYPLLDAMAVEFGESREVLSWQTVPKVWWYAPDRFAAVAPFTKSSALPFLPKYEELTVHGYELTANGFAYSATVAIRNQGTQTGAVRVVLSDLPDAGAGADYTNTLALAGNTNGAAVIAMPVANTGARRLRLSLIPEHEPAAAWLKTTVSEMPVLKVFSAYTDRSYYTTEETAGVVCQVGLPPASWTNLIVAGTGGAPELVFAGAVTAAQTRIVLPLTNLASGRYPLTLTLVTQAASSQALARVDLELIKREPFPCREWKIDRENCRVLRNGRPEFIYGVLMGHRIAACAQNMETNLQEIAAAGFNTLVYWNTGASNQELIRAMDLAWKYGLNFIVRLEMFGDGATFQPKVPWLTWPYVGLTFLKMDMASRAQLVNLPRKEKSRRFAEVFDQAVPLIRDGILSIRNHPALAFYDSFDEPSVERYFDHYVQGRQLYRLADELDGYHPVHVLWNADLPPAEEKYTDWRDVISRDPYWAPPVRGGRTSPLFVGMQTDEMFQRALVERKPVWPTPVLESCGSRHFKRLTAPDEQRSQTYLSLIYGASGFLYFIYPVIHQATWDGMAALGREIKEMTPWLVTLPVPIELDYLAGSNRVAASDIAAREVHVTVRHVAGQGYLLLAANSALHPVDVAMTLPWPGLEKQVRQLFAGRTHTLKDGVLAVRLEPLATRAYQLQADACSGPLALGVRVTPHPELGRPVEEEAPRTGRAGRRNLMPNPGFEEATLPQYPDYWFPQAGGMAWNPEQRVGRSTPNLALDENDPYEGKTSFRLHAPAGARARSVYIRFGPQHDQPTPYVFSVYLKGSRDGLPAQLNTPGGSKHVLVTTAWQRYFMPFTLPANSTRSATFALALMDEGTLWMDAVQLEPGVEPTPFDP